MDKEHLKSAGNKIAGSAKEAVGEATNDKSLELKGKLQQAKGDAQDKVGDAKDALDNAKSKL